MHEDIDEDEHPPVEQQRDTELTLGPMLLLGLFFGLVLLCGLCFGVGYSMGSRSAQGASTAGLQPGVVASSPSAGSLLKPSAVAQNIPPPPQPVVADLPPSGISGTTPGADSQALPAAATSPAPAPVSAQPAPTLPAPAVKVAPATAAAGTLMVQIAAVSHQEDADVLVGALRKRGYAVTARRDAADNQFHVRTGPFSSRNEADAMRQKLLKDGYNAIVQP